eukprot:COSAG06_NODE_1067_length_10841_cov_235.349283_6_plen_105_part_00
MDTGQDVPETCPVGCALVFPEFMETCRDHVLDNPQLDDADFEAFERRCLDQDGLALVECVLSCPVVSRPVLSCPVMPCHVLSCPIVSCPVLSCPVCPVLSYIRW